MRTVTCESCKTTLPRHSAVLRGNLHGIKAWHPDCFTVARALDGVTELALATR